MNKVIKEGIRMSLIFIIGSLVLGFLSKQMGWKL